MFFWPKNGGHILSCNWCHEHLNEDDYQNLLIIREALRNEKDT